MKPLNLVTVSAEVSPYSKSGGLGDVAAALPKTLAKFGHRVIIVTPFYGFMKNQNIPREDVGEGRIQVGQHSYTLKFKISRPREHLEVYFVCNEELFGHYQVHMYGHANDAVRFSVFNRGVLILLDLLHEQQRFVPDIIHCHDWHTGLLPNLWKLERGNDQRFSNTATVFTIHNLPFQMQGGWWTVPEDKRDDGRGLPSNDPRDIRWLNFTRRGIMYADAINTVSVRYAKEILTPEFGQGLDRLLHKREQDVFGIINGIDYTVYNPQFDPHIWQKYDWNALDRKHKNKRELQKLVGLEQSNDIPLVGLVHRLTEQKGFELITQALPILLRLPLQMLIVGTGDRDYIAVFKKAAKNYPNKIGIFTPPIGSDVNDELSSRVYAGSDMFLMPSRYEPCGISQLISLRYGSIPIVHETGGLSDTVVDFDPRTGMGTGFVFSHYTHEGLLIAMVRALETYKYPQIWEHLTWQAMQESYSWDIPAQKYTQLYRHALRVHQHHQKSE